MAADVSVNKLGPLSIELKFVITPDEVEKNFNDFCDEIKDKVLVDGFRKGHTPLNVIRQKFNEVIRTEISTRMVHRHTEDAIKARSIKIAGNPSLNEDFRATDKRKWLGEFKLDGSFVFAISTEIEPEIDVVDYTGVKVKLDLPDPQTWIEQKIAQFQLDFAEKTPVDRPAQKGDEITIDYTSFIGDQLVEDGFESWKTIIIGSGEMLDGFEDALIGRKPEEEFEFEMAFGPDEQVKAIAGKTVRFVVKIHTVVEVKLHPINDELAQKAVFENVAQMMSELSAKADEDYSKPRKAKILNAIMDDILERHPFQVPNCWIDNEMKIVAYRLGLKEFPTDINELNGLRQVALRSVQQNFIIDNIYRKEPQLRLTPEQIQAVLEVEGKKVNKTAAEVVGILKNAGTYEGFISFYEQQKVIEFLIASADITTQGISTGLTDKE